MTKAILVHRGLRRVAVAALAVVTLAGTQAQTNAPFINPTKPTAEQMALAASRGLYTGQVLHFGESVPVAEMTDVPTGVLRKRLASDPFYETINSSNRRPMRVADKSMAGKPDGALWSEQTRAPIRNLPNPATVQFDGIVFTDTTAIGQGFLPPDTTGAVGPNHYVQAVNSAFRVWDRAGAALTATIPFSTLFGTLSGACRTANDGDPVVLYDQLADRWLISQFCTLADPNNHQLIAISKTPDPTGAYYLYDFQMPNNKFNDYPKFGLWPDGYYMTDNQFNQAGTAFQQSGVFAFDRAKMLAGDPTASFVYFDTAVLFPPGGVNGTYGIGGILPGSLDGLALPPAGAPAPFAYFQAVEFGDPADQLRIFDFKVDFATPANSTFTERTGSPLTVPAFDPRPGSATTRSVVPQPSTTVGLDALEDRLMFRLGYRNLGTSESLVMTHTVNAATYPAYRAAVRFYDLRRSTPTGAFSVREAQTFDGGAADTAHRWMGSVAMNHQGDIALGYSVSSSSVSPSIRYAARLGTDAAGTGLVSGEQSIIAGSGAQTSASSRWGDYSQMSLDPVDDCTFWFTQEYQASAASAAWRTRIAKFAPGTCTPSPRGTISGTLTNCSTSAPVSGVTVSITGGFLRVTGAAGTYSAAVSPGTYTATARLAGYNSLTSGSLVVTNGGVATFSGCLTPVPIVNSALPVVITAEDAVLLNSAADPGERLTVSLPLVNVGTANTTNLVATLQANAGVTNPSAAATYGSVIAAGAAVSRPFTFKAAGTCGDNITLNLSLQDGATNLGTASYTMRLGSTPAPYFIEAYDGVTAPALPGGWTTAISGGLTAWTTVATGPVNSTPNVAVAPSAAAVGNTELISPAIAVPAGGAQLAFRNLYNLESGVSNYFDGMVLEYSVNGGAFTDITSGGNAFLTGGYTGTISASFGSAIASRSAWSGLSGGTTAAPTYINSVINLPAAAAGQMVRLKWRVATDSSVSATGLAGARIDNITLTALSAYCGIPRALDVDLNGGYAGATDAVIMLRYLLGYRGNAMIANALGGGATRTTAAAMLTHLDSIRPLLDIDNNGSVDALTDGLMILRFMLGLPQAAVVAGAVGPAATRDAAAIMNYLVTITPTVP